MWKLNILTPELKSGLATPLWGKGGGEGMGRKGRHGGEKKNDTRLDSANCSVDFGPKLDPSESVSLIRELGIIMPAP